MKSLSVLFPELTEGQWAMLLRLLMEAAPEMNLPEADRLIPVDNKHKVDSSVLPLIQNTGHNAAVEAYKRNITLLLEGKNHGG